MVKFGQRWYNPTTGTWTQQNTLDAPLDPANANRYSFAGGDRINGNDPTGQDGWGCFWASLGVAGAFTTDLFAIGAAAGTVATGGALAPVDIGANALAIGFTAAAIGGFSDAC